MAKKKSVGVKIDSVTGAMIVDGTQPGQQHYAHPMSPTKVEGMPDVIHMNFVSKEEIAAKSPETISPSSQSVLDAAEEPAIMWDGITRRETLQTYSCQPGWQVRRDLADYAKAYNWAKVLEILLKHPEIVNATRPDGQSFYTPLHQAAHGGANIAVVTALLKLGAWRTLRDSKGRRPVDISGSRRTEIIDVLDILQPVHRRHVPEAVLAGIQWQFHALIMKRAGRLIESQALRRPELEVMLEFHSRKFWFAVPGMFGGFAYWLAYPGPKAKLICESWSRMEDGSGLRHEITASESTLLDEGFV